MIRASVQDRIATIALHRPEARNAIPVAQWEALRAAIVALDGQDVRALILRSETPGVFSAGADLGEFAALRADPGLRPAFRQSMRDAIEALAAARFPTLAAVDGGCFGAAVALALACDIRIAGGEAAFGITPAKFGITYPREDVARLSMQVGKGQAARLLFTGGTIPAAEAARIGLVEILAPRAVDVAEHIAAGIAGNAPGAVRQLKAILADPADRAHDQAFEDAFGGAEFVDGLAALRARRAPGF